MNAADFWFLDPDERTEEQPKPNLWARIMSSISRMMWWRDGKEEEEPAKKRSGSIEVESGGLRGRDVQEDAELLFDCESTGND